MSDLERLMAYWTVFSRDQKTVLNGGVALENTDLPFLEVNAGYALGTDDVSALGSRFAARGRPGVLIVTEGSNLELTVRNAGFTPYSGITVLEIEADANLEPTVWVEQVPWSLARAVGEVIAVAKGAHSWAELISTEVARAMQSDPSLTAYLAFHADQPVGALLARHDASFLWGVTPAGTKVDAARALANRAALETGQLRIGVQDSDLEMFEGTKLERFVAWVKHY